MDPLNLPRKVSGMTLSTLAKGFYSTMPLGRKVDREPLACEDAWYKLWYKQIGQCMLCYSGIAKSADILAGTSSENL